MPRSEEFKMRFSEEQIEEIAQRAAAIVADRQADAVGLAAPHYTEGDTWSDGYVRRPYLLELSVCGFFKDDGEAERAGTTIAGYLARVMAGNETIETVTLANVDGEFLRS